MRREHLYPDDKLRRTTGIIRLAYRPALGNPTGPLFVSGDLLGGKTATTNESALNFRRSDEIQHLLQHVSTLLKAVDLEQWRKYRTIYEFLRTHHPETMSLLDKDDYDKVLCYSGIYVLVNMLTDIHRDLMDPKDGWVAMMVVGDCHSGGDLYLPDIDTQILYRPG